MKLTTATMVTVDGVLQGLGAPDEDRRGGFERGGWAAPLFDKEAGAFLNQVYGRADAFLFGRWTYEVFAGSWGTWADPFDGLVVDVLRQAARVHPRACSVSPRRRAACQQFPLCVRRRP